VEGQEKPPHYYLKETSKVLRWIHLVIHFPEIKYSSSRISGWGQSQRE
jgi:hypothetical protein